MKKITFINPTLRSAGGLGKIVISLANILSKSNFQVSMIVSSAYENTIFYPINENIQVVKFRGDFGITDKGNYLNKKINFFKDVKEVGKKINELNPDIIISTSYPLTVSGTINNLFNKRVHIIWHHSNFLEEKSFLWNLFSSMSYWLADAIVCINKDEYIGYSRFNSNAITISNFISPTSKRSELNSKQILTIARLVYSKGIDLLIESAKIILEKHPDWTWKIIGTGNLYEEIIQSIDEAGLKHRLLLQEPQSYDLEPDYLKSSIYVLSSRLEPFGMVLIEAMNYGIPCVAFDCETGPRHIISNKTDGFLVEKEKPEKLAEAIDWLIKNEDLRLKMGTSAKKNVERFYYKSIVQQWIELLNKP